MLDIDVFIEKIKKKSRLIGIDPGGKRIGVAISDENKIVATPFSTIVKNKYSVFIKDIKKIVEENHIKGIVIGNPINMDGSPSQSSQSAKDLAINLSKDITCHTIDNQSDYMKEIREEFNKAAQEQLTTFFTAFKNIVQPQKPFKDIMVNANPPYPMEPPLTPPSP